jgi:glycerophosphoryl diester phosphodiesterase
VIEIWAHRGASRAAPENTLPAFELAVEAGADGIEFDVQFSRDGHLVVIHDETLPRTTDGTGQVLDHTLAELKALDASNGVDGYAGARIPTLAEVLELLAPTSLRANIELKNSEVPYPGLEEAVLAAVAAAGMAERTVYSSFSGESVRRLAGMAPMAEVGLIYSRPLARPLRLAEALGASAVHPDRRLVGGRGWVNRAHARHLAVRPWVLNTPRRIRRAISRGVDGLFTDVPGLALMIRDEAGSAQER